MVVLAHGLRAGGGKTIGVNVIDALVAARPEYRFLMVVPQDADYASVQCPRDAEVLEHRYRGALERAVFDGVTLPRAIGRFAPDVVLGLGNLGLARPAAPQAILVLKPQLVYPKDECPPEVLSRRIVTRMIEWQLRRALPRTQVVFCQTRVMRDRFRAKFGYEGRLTVMPVGISRKIIKSTVGAEPQALRSVKAPCRLLALTRYYPHKNLDVIVDCFAEFRRELEDVKCILTIEPGEHPNAAQLLQRIWRLGLDEQIVNVGRISHSELADYYRYTDGVLLPTLLESYSSAYVEAMAFSKPILTSDRDFARETCGEAAWFFDPLDPGALMRVIRRLRSGGKSVDELVAAGQRQLRRCKRNWREIIDEAMKVVESTCLSKARNAD